MDSNFDIIDHSYIELVVKSIPAPHASSGYLEEKKWNITIGT